METRERERSESSQLLTSGGSDGVPAGPGATERATRLADAADRAIQDSLSQDSARFLSQNRQEGGE